MLVSLPLTFVPMAALFDGERAGPAFASSLRAFARNPRPMLALGVYTFALLLAGLATTGIGLVLAPALDRGGAIRGVEGHLRRRKRSSRRAPGEVA